MPQKHDLGRRKQKGRTARQKAGYTAGQLEALATQLVDAGLCSDVILTTPRSMYRDRKKNR